MTAVIGMVAFILVMIGISTSAILTQVLYVNLGAQVDEAAASIQPRAAFQSSAEQVLESGFFDSGTLLVMNSRGTGITGAVVGDNGARALTTDDLGRIADSLQAAAADPNAQTVDLPNLGEYLVRPFQTPGSDSIFLVGLPLSSVTSTIGAILTTVALVTTGGLLLLAVIIAIVIRLGLRPLRAVAETATRVASLRMDQGDVSITERVPADQVDDHTEIGQVGTALNTLLDRVDASLSARQRNEELMRRFVADASHELRTPLASIRGFSELSLRAMRQAQDDESRQRISLAVETTEQSLERIQAQSLRMTTLVEDLLLLARLDEGQELVYGSVDLTRLAVEAVGDARPAGPDHSWTIDVPDTPVELAGDAARLHQVVANLLANARTHTPAGSEVDVSVAHEGAEAVLGCTTTVPASIPRSPRSSSSGSPAPIARATARPAVPAWACRSRGRSSTPTAERSRSRALPATRPSRCASGEARGSGDRGHGLRPRDAGGQAHRDLTAVRAASRSGPGATSMSGARGPS